MSVSEYPTQPPIEKRDGSELTLASELGLKGLQNSVLSQQGANLGHQSQTIPQWSVVVIARNEEAVIGDCLKSVTTAFAGRSYELIIVDSASTDRTVEIAQDFNARIIELASTAPLRPAVGRHVGFQASRGQWILFLDGDSILESAWVTSADAALRTEESLGGIAGEMKHVSPEIKNEVNDFNRSYPDSDYEAAAYLAGSAAYKREAFLKAGGFNPFLHAAEEAELGARLRKCGYILRRLRMRMTEHFPKHRGETVPELFRRVRRGFYLGIGQLARYATKYDLPIHEPLRPLYRYFEFLTLLLFGVGAATVSVTTASPTALITWLALTVLAYLTFAFRARSLRKPAYYFLEWTLTSPLVIWGLLKCPRTGDEFPNLVDTRPRRCVGDEVTEAD